jgi:hypothetical protein
VNNNGNKNGGQSYWHCNYPQNQSREQNASDDFADLDDFGFVLKFFHKLKRLITFMAQGINQSIPLVKSFLLRNDN